MLPLSRPQLARHCTAVPEPPGQQGAPSSCAVAARAKLCWVRCRADPALQELHRRVPFIAVSDDHEIADSAHTRVSRGRDGGAVWWRQPGQQATLATCRLPNDRRRWWLCRLHAAAAESCRGRMILMETASSGRSRSTRRCRWAPPACRPLRRKHTDRQGPIQGRPAGWQAATPRPGALTVWSNVPFCVHHRKGERHRCGCLCTAALCMNAAALSGIPPPAPPAPAGLY